MADPEHLELLKQGAEVWNKWREAEFYAKPNLRNADLRAIDLSKVSLEEADLTGVDLRGQDLTAAFLYDTNLTEARLTKANLSGANLVAANLYRADLVSAILESADLQAADLRDADLQNCRLIEANLNGSILNGANLNKADLNRATINATTFGDNDLSEVIGLESIVHVGPSVIGVNTLYKSRGKIPRIFLQGCGVPESFITYANALVQNAIEFYSCFISYSSKDEEFASKLYSDLQELGVRCWYAPEALGIGDKLRDKIDESIRVYDKLVLILSENSVGSEWVKIEAETAIKVERAHNRIVLFPLRIDQEVMEVRDEWLALLWRTRQIADFSDWRREDTYQKAFSRLARDLTLSGAVDTKDLGRP
jgi:hypothetical protein